MSHRRPTLVTVVLVVFAVFAGACSGDDDPAGGPTDPAAAADARLDAEAAEPDLSVSGDGPTGTGSTSTTTTSTTTTTTTVPGIVVNAYALTIDECFDQVEGLEQGRARVVTTRIPCDAPHGYQIFGRLDYPAEHPSAYPGDDVMEDFALASCYRRFEDWADSVYETSVLEIGAITPNRENFEEVGYRGIQCHVRRTDREPLIGTARSSGL